MESYQKTKIPPPVPPKHHKSTLVASPVLYQKENIHVYKNGYHHHPATSVTGGALIQTNGMRVKIQINPENPVHENNCRTVLGSTSQTNSGNGLKVNVNGTDGVSTQSHSHDMLLASSACNNCNSGNTTASKQHLRNKFIYPNRNNVRNNSNDDFSTTNSIVATRNSSTKNLIEAFGGANVTTTTTTSSTTITSTKSPSSNISSRYLNAIGNVHGYFYTNSLPSGQSSPSDNLDSGTCSDVDTGTSPPPQPHQPAYFGAKKRSAAAKISPPPSQHQRSGSLNSSGIGVDSEDEDNASCDSINSSEYNGENEHTLPIISAAILKCNSTRGITSSASAVSSKRTYEQNGLQHSSCPISNDHHRGYVANNNNNNSSNNNNNEDENRRQEIGYASPPPPYDNDVEENTDKYLHFHLNENNFNKDDETRSEDDSFAGFKSLIEKSSPVTTIQSARGTVRGVKNRVRAGIATFLNNSVTKTWQDKEAGKVVVYTTTMGIIRETYHRCLKVRQILKTHLVKFEEKDVFMSREVQKEIRERMKIDEIVVPQVFVEGLHIGDAETIERLNESGELRKILKPYKSADALNTCQVCGGYRLLPCNICNGSKKSVRRPNFTELVPLKCMNCDEVGLIKCYAC